MNRTIPTRYTAAQLVKMHGIASAADPSDTFTVRSWTGDTMTAADWLRWFRRKLHTKINGPITPAGRKHDPDWQRQTMQFAARANTPRLILGWIPADFRHRFKHRDEHTYNRPHRRNR